MATYVKRRKTAKGDKHSNQDKQGKHAQHPNPAAGTHDFANQQRMKELSEKRGPFGVDLDGIR